MDRERVILGVFLLTVSCFMWLMTYKFYVLGQKYNDLSNEYEKAIESSRSMFYGYHNKKYEDSVALRSFMDSQAQHEIDSASNYFMDSLRRNGI